MFLEKARDITDRMLPAWDTSSGIPYNGPVHLAYNPSYSACVFSSVFQQSTQVFFSHKKSVNSVFQPAYNSSRTGPIEST
jgi:hypothetical protein